MARLLWVTDDPPSRHLGGGNIREANLLLNLAKWYDVTLLVTGGAIDPAVADAVDVVDVGEQHLDRNTSSKTSAVLSSFTRRGPSDVLRGEASRPALARRLGTLAQEHDVVLLTNLQLAPLVRTRTAGATARWVAHMHHVPSVQLGQRAAVARRARLRIRLSGEARIATYWERIAATKTDAMLAVSADDADHFRRLGASDVIVSPNGVDLERFTPTPLPSEPTAVFTASLSYPPNSDAARWLAVEIWPLVLARVPHARLSIVGRSASIAQPALADEPGVSLHSDVPEIVPYIEAARVAVVPLRAGTGTRLKVLEAMAAGRPVVGTSIGLEGLDLRDGVDALMADTPAEIADALVTLFEDDERAQAMAAAGRVAAGAFGWPEIADRLRADLDRLLASP